ncbi:hypothetical protein [Saccharopolyspora rhizosphaerae]|nr:hypothetical protein [Saccharopolyspora rhizosphaerae]
MGWASPGLARTTSDLLEQRSTTQAVARCDALLHAGAITVDEIVDFLVPR